MPRLCNAPDHIHSRLERQECLVGPVQQADHSDHADKRAVRQNAFENVIDRLQNPRILRHIGADRFFDLIQCALRSAHKEAQCGYSHHQEWNQGQQRAVGACARHKTALVGAVSINQAPNVAEDAFERISLARRLFAVRQFGNMMLHPGKRPAAMLLLVFGFRFWHALPSVFATIWFGIDRDASEERRWAAADSATRPRARCCSCCSTW